MKKFNLISMIFTFVVMMGVQSFAQQKVELTVEQWEAEMARLKAKKESLTKENEAVQNDVNALQQKLTSMKSYDDCLDELYAMIGAKKAQIDNFRKAVTELEGKIRRKEGPKADRQADLDALKANKISALPEFFDRVHNQMQKMLNEWVEEVVVKDVMYTVVKGDCLWYIARRKEFYGNGFAWPKIYQANRDQIKNPDLIYPNQSFKIPPLTEDEKSKYEKLRANYKPAPVQ